MRSTSICTYNAVVIYVVGVFLVSMMFQRVSSQMFFLAKEKLDDEGKFTVCGFKIAQYRYYTPPKTNMFPGIGDVLIVFCRIEF